jgi:hypothetical protein
MTAQPDSIRFYHPHEVEDPKTVPVFSTYTEDTVPNPPFTDMDEAIQILLKHIVEFVNADTEDPNVRHCCLIADLGVWWDDVVGFCRLVDLYKEDMEPNAAEFYTELLRDYLRGAK